MQAVNRSPVTHVQPVAFEVPILHSQISIDDLFLHFTMFRRKETQGDGEWRLRFIDTPNAIGCKQMQIVERSP